jgi:putative membrane protein
MRTHSVLIAAVTALCMPASQAFAGAPAEPPAPAPELNSAMTDVDFLVTAASSDEFERRSGAIAVQRGQHESVRSMGQRLIEDHTRSTEMLTAAAQAAGLPPPTPVLHPGLQRKLQELETVPAEIFDQVWLQTQAEAHVDARQLMKTCTQVCDAEPLRDTAAEVVVVVQRHLSHVLRIQREFDPAT